MGLIEEEDQLRLLRVADLGQVLVELREQPEEERRIEARRLHEDVGGKDIDHAAAVSGGAHHLRDVERRLAEEAVRALLLQHEERALDGADGGLRDIAVAGGEVARLVGDISEERLQILEVEEEEALLVGEAEGDVEHALLGVVQVEQAGKEERPDLRDGRTDGMALLAEEVPEDDREGLELVLGGEADLLGALGEEVLGRACLREAGEVALHVGAEDRHAGGGEALGHDLQRYGLAGAGGAGDQAVAIGIGELDIFRLGAGPEEHPALLKHAHLRSPSALKAAT